jgi:hypothetical protein
MLAPACMWSINGYPAEVTVWTALQWASLHPKPSDAQPYHDGLWVALRMA